MKIWVGTDVACCHTAVRQSKTPQEQYSFWQQIRRLILNPPLFHLPRSKCFFITPKSYLSDNLSLPAGYNFDGHAVHFCYITTGNRTDICFVFGNCSLVFFRTTNCRFARATGFLIIFVGPVVLSTFLTDYITFNEYRVYSGE